MTQEALQELLATRAKILRGEQPTIEEIRRAIELLRADRKPDRKRKQPTRQLEVFGDGEETMVR